MSISKIELLQVFGPTRVPQAFVVVDTTLVQKYDRQDISLNLHDIRTGDPNSRHTVTAGSDGEVQEQGLGEPDALMR